MFQVFSNVKKSSKYFEEITLTALVARIKDNPQKSDIEFARYLIGENGKKDKDALKIKEGLTAFTPNSFSYNGWRSSQKLNSTGYIYFDFDGFQSTEEATNFKESIKYISHIYSCWLSVSARGVGLLFKVDSTKVNKVSFNQYWQHINNTFFHGKADQRTNDFVRLNIISSDEEIYVNNNVEEYNESIEYESSICYKTVLPYELTDHSKPFTIIPYPSIEIDTYYLSKHKIRTGSRNSSLGAISMQLIYLNPKGDFLQILNATKYINRNYAVEPLTEKEVKDIVMANWKKRIKIINNEGGILDKYFKVKTVWFKTKLPLSEMRTISAQSRRIINTQKIEKLLNNLSIPFQSEKLLMQFLIKETELTKVTIDRILDNVPLCKSNYIKGFDNIDANAKRDILSDIHFRIYSAIEDLQDSRNKITQPRVSEYLGINVKTVKRNWLPSFKNLVKTYNNTLRSKKYRMMEESYTENENLIEADCDRYYNNRLTR